MFFMCQVLFKADGTVDKGTTDYANLDAAEIAFHTAIASAISKEQYTGMTIFVFDTKGRQYFNRTWERTAKE